MIVAGMGFSRGRSSRTVGADAATTAAGLTYLHWFLPGMALHSRWWRWDRRWRHRHRQADDGGADGGRYC